MHFWGPKATNYLYEIKEFKVKLYINEVFNDSIAFCKNDNLALLQNHFILD